MPETAAAPDADQELFERSRAEVQLLLEFVSGRADASYRPPSSAPAEEQKRFEENFDKVAAICFGPMPTPAERPAAAKILLAERDRLSRLAYPARSLTIAYSAMFAGVARLPPYRHRLASWLRRKLYDGEPTDSDAVAHHQHRSTLVAMSTRAWPGLVPNVRLFRYICGLIGVITLIGLILTLFTYWDVAYGRLLLTRIGLAETDLASPAKSTPADASCATPAQAGTPDCIRLHAARQQRLDDARTDLSSFADCQGLVCGLHVIHWGAILSGYKGKLSDESRKRMPATKPIEQTLAPIIAVFGNFVLPMMFGYLGTLTGLFRTVRDKMRDSTLAPQDFVMVLISVPLGLVAGVAVGLFYNSANGSSDSLALPSGVGTTLNVSGLAFIAGYAAESFFAALDSLRTRLFQATSPPAPPPVQHTGG